MKKAKNCYLAVDFSRSHCMKMMICMIVMIPCLVIHFTIYTYLSMYICCGIFIFACIVFHVVRNKHYIYLDTEETIIYMPDRVIKVDDINMEKIWVQNMLSRSCMGFYVTFDDEKIVFPIKTIQEKAVLEKTLSPDAEVEILTEKNEKLKIGLVITISMTFFALPLFMGLGETSAPTGPSSQNVDCTKIYYTETSLETLPDAVARLDSGDICAMYGTGATNVYDENGKYKYSYRVPRIEGEACEMAIDGTYVFIITCRQDIVFVYRGDSFVEKLELDAAEKKYNMKYICDYGEDPDEELCKIIRPDYEEPGKFLSYLGVLVLSVFLTAFFLSRKAEAELIDENEEELL